MPRPKTNVFVDYMKEPVIRSIKVGHDISTDSYWIDIREAKDKLIAKNVLMEQSYIIRDFKKYYFSNILIEKTKYKINIKAIYEKDGINNFVSNDNVEDKLRGLNIEKLEGIDGCYTVNIENINTTNVIKDIYLAGAYIIRNNEKSYLSQFTIMFENSCFVKNYFYITVFFNWLEDNHLNEMRHFLHK